MNNSFTGRVSTRYFTGIVFRSHSKLEMIPKHVLVTFLPKERSIIHDSS